MHVDDCLKLSLLPGTYAINYRYNTTLHYNAVFVTPSANVTFTCLLTYIRKVEWLHVPPDKIFPHAIQVISSYIAMLKP